MPLSDSTKRHLRIATASNDIGDVLSDHLDSLTNHLETADNGNYSTEEINTGHVWIDGKPIFRKVFTVLAQGNSDADTIALGFTVDALISVNGYVDDGILKKPLPFNPLSTEANEAIRVILNSSGANLQIRTGSSGAHDGGNVVIEYTKA